MEGRCGGTVLADITVRFLWALTLHPVPHPKAPTIHTAPSPSALTLRTVPSPGALLTNCASTLDPPYLTIRLAPDVAEVGSPRPVWGAFRRKCQGPSQVGPPEVNASTTTTARNSRGHTNGSALVCRFNHQRNPSVVRQNPSLAVSLIPYLKFEYTQSLPSNSRFNTDVLAISSNKETYDIVSAPSAKHTC